MPNQEIGVKSQFETKQFSRGLGVYLKGLSNAIAATNNTVAAINNLGTVSTANFATIQQGAATTAAALRALGQAAAAAQRAAQNATNPRQPRTRANPAGGGAAAQTANVPGTPNQRTIQNINNATVATRNLGSQAQKTSINLQTLSTKSIAVGTAIGNIAAQAIIGFGRSLVAFGSEVLEIVTFFERLDLSIGFFAARSFQAEDATLSFSDALALGASEAQGLSIWLQRLAVASPFTTRDVGILFRTAQAYGLTRKEAEQLTPLLLDFAAAAGLNEDILERLALAVGQIRARGKLTGEEVRQLGNSGIPIRDILVKALGIANEEFDALLESGAFTSDIVIPAIIDSLKDFEGAGERVAFGTIGGIISAFDELREIGIAKFFTGLLEPLKKSFQQLFAVLNQPQVLAFITVLGREIGVNLRNAVFGVITSIRGLITSWQALSATQQQQIIVFAAATAGVIALVAAFGLLTIAVNVILSPLSLLALTIGFLVSEWTSGFAVLKSITGSVAASIGKSLAQAQDGVESAIDAIAGVFENVGDAIGVAEDRFAMFGVNITKSLASGIERAAPLLTGAMRGIGSLLTFWLAPGSPPRVAPDIDDYGAATMEEYVKAFGNANIRKSLGDSMSIVSDTITQELIDARRKAVDELNQAHPDLNLTLAQDLNRTIQEGFKETEDALTDTSGVEDAATDAGIRVSDAFVNSFLSRIPELTPRISKELQEVLNKIGGGTRLTREGALSFGKYLEGFGDADFGVLDDVSNVIEGFFRTLVDTGQIEEIDLPRLLFGAREDLAQGIKDIEEVGQVTQSTMQRIRGSSGAASQNVLALLNSYAPLAAATKSVKEGQDALNAVTEKYKAILTPLRKELDAINEANKRADEGEKVLSLQRVIANNAVSNRRRQNAQLQINQIVAEQRVRGLEAEREAATNTAEEELASREKVKDALELQFNNLQRNIQAQLTQLGLYGEEAATVRKLREEAAKLREKEMTSDELRLKFLELQGEEMSDLIDAARAKYDLERADSTELEKQQAQITLAEVALRRRNREAEAIKLGIPVSELTKLRDFAVTLDDLGIKGKEAFDFAGGDALGEGIVDADRITREWEATLERVRAKWAEIKAEILATATSINDNLPDPLKIFPEVEGEEPPIVGFIKKYGLAVIALATAINTYKMIVQFAALATAVKNLAIFGTAAGAGGAAAGAGGAAAGAAGAAGLTGMAAFVATLTTALIAFTVAVPAAILAAQGVGAAFKAFGVGQELVNLGDFGTSAQEKLTETLRNLQADPIAISVLAGQVTQVIKDAVSSGASNAEVTNAATAALSKSISDGLVADTEQNRTAIANFKSGLLAILNEERTGNELGTIDVFKGIQLAPITDEQAIKTREELTALLNGILADEETGGFAADVTKIVNDSVESGLTDAEISSQVTGAFNRGVAAGLVADTEENRASISSYVTGLLELIRLEAEIKSPSALTEREIGLPLGEGIIKGIGAAFTAGSVGLVTTTKLMFGDLVNAFTTGKQDIVAQAEEVRVKVNAKYIALRTLLATRMGEINTAQKVAWTLLRTDAEREVEAVKTFVGINFEAIRANLFSKMSEIKAVVVNAFKSMRTESELEVAALRTSIVNMLTGEEGSLLTDLNAAFLGLDQMVPKNIGKLFIEGIALGVTENRQTLADAMIDALRFAMIQTATAELEIKSPSAVGAREIGMPFVAGIAKGIMDSVGMISSATQSAMATAVQSPLEARFGSQLGAHSSATTINQSRVSNYHLNVRSEARSQGIVADFGIMETMRPR